jgi:hypothetical protein
MGSRLVGYRRVSCFWITHMYWIFIKALSPSECPRRCAVEMRGGEFGRWPICRETAPDASPVDRERLAAKGWAVNARSALRRYSFRIRTLGVVVRCNIVTPIASRECLLLSDGHQNAGRSQAEVLRADTFAKLKSTSLGLLAIPAFDRSAGLCVTDTSDLTGECAYANGFKSGRRPWPG